MGTRLAMSTAFHPKTDGPTEQANCTLKDMLRAFVNYQQDNWDQLLSAAEFTCNNAPNASTKMSPFQINYGWGPLNPYSQIHNLPDTVPAAADFLLNLKN